MLISTTVLLVVLTLLQTAGSVNQQRTRTPASGTILYECRILRLNIEDCCIIILWQRIWYPGNPALPADHIENIEHNNPHIEANIVRDRDFPHQVEGEAGNPHEFSWAKLYCVDTDVEGPNYRYGDPDDPNAVDLRGAPNWFVYPCPPGHWFSKRRQPSRTLPSELILRKGECLPGKKPKKRKHLVRKGSPDCIDSDSGEDEMGVVIQAETIKGVQTERRISRAARTTGNQRAVDLGIEDEVSVKPLLNITDFDRRNREHYTRIARLSVEEIIKVENGHTVRACTITEPGAREWDLALKMVQVYAFTQVTKPRPQ